MKEIFHFPILIELDEDGIYIVSCNSFKGCHSSGKNINEAIDNIKEVIELCIEENDELENKNQFIGFRELEIAV
jgi:predicted RNase H-like HicB family nuclease